MKHLKAYSDARREFTRAQCELNRLRTRQHAMLVKGAKPEDLASVADAIKQQVGAVTKAQAAADAAEKQIAADNKKARTADV